MIMPSEKFLIETQLTQVQTKINKILALCKIKEYKSEIQKKQLTKDDFPALLHTIKNLKTIGKNLRKVFDMSEVEDIEKYYIEQLKIEKEKEENRQRTIECKENKCNNSNLSSNTDNVLAKDENKKTKTSNNKHLFLTKKLSVSKKDSTGSNNKTSTELSRLKIYSSKPSPCVVFSPKLNPNRFLRCSTLLPKQMRLPLENLKLEVAQAVADHKTFTLRGHFPVIRKAMLSRGWIEKFHSNYRQRVDKEISKFNMYTIPELLSLMRNKDLAELCKKLIKSKLLQDHQVDLFWDYSFEAFRECSDKKKITLINRVRREPYSFTTKQGLCQCSKEMQNLSPVNHPRCYLLSKGGDTKGFIQDYGMTAAVSLLKWIVFNENANESKIVSNFGRVHMKYFEFAATEAYKLTKKQKGQEIADISDASDKEWGVFVDNFHNIVHSGHHFKLRNKIDNPKAIAKNMVQKSSYILNILQKHLPYIHMDGMMNIWIMKPTAGSQGRGIRLCKNLEVIFEYVKNSPSMRYVVQKYIEKPFLIQNTKFDIRQWFLLSSTHPMTIWMYKVCYLRFSSMPYTLKNLHESIHLTNNSVQAQYCKTACDKSIIPKYRMWDLTEFQKYLSEMGHPGVFEKSIYQGMKISIIATMMSHRNEIDKRKNCFELYGADFIVDEFFQPWLLEINSNPAMHASTPVTARLCSAALEDVIKVIVDLKENEKAFTGNFEKICEEKLDECPAR